MNRVLVCPGRFSNGAVAMSWAQRYELLLDEQIRNRQFPDNQLLTVAVETIVPCAELAAWEQGQEKWQAIQTKNGSTRRVVVNQVQPPYSLDNLYPSLVTYAEAYQQCGQAFSMAGTTFWGDMHANFTLDAQGRADPASLKATYPGAAYMVPFQDCVDTAFKQLSFPPPQNHQPVYIEALIQVQLKSR